MNQDNYNSNLFSFLSSSPTPYHAVAGIEDFLRLHGFIQLQENVPWQLEKGFSYFVTREQSAIIAFTLGSDYGFRMLAAHTDSPCLQIKPRPEIKTATYQQLGVEIYGGGLLGTWFDRDLSLAGRVVGATPDGSLAVRLLDFKRPLLTIPSIAIHFNREANNNNAIDRQKHLPPIIAQSIDKQLPEFSSLLVEQFRLEHPKAMIEEILRDLYVADPV